MKKEIKKNGIYPRKIYEKKTKYGAESAWIEQHGDRSIITWKNKTNLGVRTREFLITDPNPSNKIIGAVLGQICR